MEKGDFVPPMDPRVRSRPPQPPRSGFITPSLPIPPSQPHPARHAHHHAPSPSPLAPFMSTSGQSPAFFQPPPHMVATPTSTAMPPPKPSFPGRADPQTRSVSLDPRSRSVNPQTPADPRTRPVAPQIMGPVNPQTGQVVPQFQAGQLDPRIRSMNPRIRPSDPHTYPQAPVAYQQSATPTWRPHPPSIPLSPVNNPHHTYPQPMQVPLTPYQMSVAHFRPLPIPISTHMRPHPQQGGVAHYDRPCGSGSEVSIPSVSTQDPYVAEWLRKVSERRPVQEDRHMKPVLCYNPQRLVCLGYLNRLVKPVYVEKQQPGIVYYGHKRSKKGSENGQILKGKSPQIQYTIPEVRSLLMKGVELLSQLNSAHRAMCHEDISMWNERKLNVDAAKDSFLHIRSQLESCPGLKEHLSRKMTIIRSRRERRKRSWSERKERWRESMTRAERVTDEWVQNEQQKALKAKMEKSVQASASGVLEEVKRKKTDLKSLLDMAETLRELRTLRREASRKKGDAPPIEADEKFNTNHESLVEMLTQQLSVYQREEHALRVLMEEEVKEKMHSHQTKAAQVHTSQPAITAPLNTLEGCTQFYLQARVNKESKKAIRSDWDTFISPEGTPLPDHTHLMSTTPPDNPAWQRYCNRET